MKNTIIITLLCILITSCTSEKDKISEKRDNLFNHYKQMNELLEMQMSSLKTASDTTSMAKIGSQIRATRKHMDSTMEVIHSLERELESK